MINEQLRLFIPTEAEYKEPPKTTHEELMDAHSDWFSGIYPLASTIGDVVRIRRDLSQSEFELDSQSEELFIPKVIGRQAVLAANGYEISD